MNTAHSTATLPRIASVPMVLRCVNFYCGKTGNHFAAYHLADGSRMYACETCHDTQRVLSHIWEASEAQHASRVPEVAPKRSMPIPWTNAYGHAARNGAPALAHYIATQQWLKANAAGDVVNACRWNVRRYDSAIALTGGPSAINRALVGRA